jgi:hypothetical protein
VVAVAADDHRQLQILLVVPVASRLLIGLPDQGVVAQRERLVLRVLVALAGITYKQLVALVELVAAGVQQVQVAGSAALKV